jgi:hypothetical protein
MRQTIAPPWSPRRYANHDLYRTPTTMPRDGRQAKVCLASPGLPQGRLKVLVSCEAHVGEQFFSIHWTESSGHVTRQIAVGALQVGQVHIEFRLRISLHHQRETPATLSILFQASKCHAKRSGSVLWARSTWIL